MADTIFYKLNSGKPFKAIYFVRKYLELLIPDFIYRKRLKSVIQAAARRDDFDYVKKRVAYYCRLSEEWQINPQDFTHKERSTFFFRGAIAGYKRKMFHTAYYLDQHDVTKWFDKSFRWSYCPGDVYFTPNEPTVVKSRMLNEVNTNSVILKLDKLRHFIFLNDTLSFEDKLDKAIFRGKIRQSRLRNLFLEKFMNHPMIDCGVVGKNEGCPDEWMKPKKTIREHLDYKFIIALEGNDVASNLKWVMSSNSLAVMTRPTCETWFMEGTLVPGVHYVEVKEDFSDLEAKLLYYINHPDEAQQIINQAHSYIAQFKDEKREELIQLMVMNRYFSLSGQMLSYF